MPAIPAVGDTPAANPVPSEPNPSEKPLHIRCEDGSLLEVEKMDIPRRLKHVLREMDLDASGFVDEKNLEDSLKILRHLKKGLDTDGSGHVTNQEMEDGVSLLTLLMTEKANNSKEMPYKHLPEQIQEVMREWDLDGSGMVGVEELTAAAGAYKKIQQEGRLMRKIIVAMALVILFLMGAMFALSITAVEITKEMRGTSTGVMESTDPEGNQIVVKVASSDFEMAADGSLIIRGAIGANATCPENTTCRRLQAANNVISVAQKETARRLSSTLPDDSFKELKQLTLKDNLGHTLKVTITSFQRLRLRSSRCGSVIHLYSEKGRFTLDDYEMTADAAMEAYVKDAGMEGLFETVAGDAGFGRRLSSTDGMLEGFFNMLEDVEWECESVDLPSPNDIPQYYHATIHVKHLHNRPAKAYSKYFKDEDGQWLLLPGVLEENGKIYKTWREELVKSAGVTAYLSEYAMHPLQRELRLKKGGVQATIEGMGRTGYRCFLEAPEPSSMKSAAGAAVPTMEFMGVHVENGTVLRKWRLDPMGDLDEQDEGSENTIGMMEAGLIPNRVDYYDVDTDPSGRFESGQPYRIHMYSTVAGSKIDTVKQYMSIKALPSVFEVPGMFEFFNITRLDGKCGFARELLAGNASNATNTSKAAFESATMLADEVVGSLGVANRSSWDPNFHMPPEIYPWSELPSALLYNYKQLQFYLSRGDHRPELMNARMFKYWEALFTSVENQDELFDHEFVDYMAEMTQANNDTNTSYQSGGSRRLLSRRLGSRVDHGDGTYSVEINSEDLKPADPDHPLRRLSAAGRRLDDNEPPWKYKAWVTPERIEIEADIGKANLKFLVQYCNLWNPTATNWGACMTGRAGAGDIVKLEGYCSGTQIFWPFPKVSLTLGGLLVYDDTAAMGIEQDRDFYLENMEGRERVLGMDGWSYKWYDRGQAGTKDTWQIRSADPGITVIGSDSRVFIRNMNTGRHIQDNNGNVRMSSNTGGWEKFKVLDAGGGKVYLQSHRGAYLAIREDKNWGSLECKVTLYEDRNCRGGSRVERSTDSSGQTFGPYGRRRRRRRYVYISDEWRSAKGEGHCRQVEFFDEDESETMYEDNLWQSGNFGCFDFEDMDGGSDVDEDLGGLKIWAEGPDPPVFGSNGKVDLIFTWTKDTRAKWIMTKTPNPSDEKDSGSIVSFGDALLYGGLTFEKEIEIIWGIKASWTTEIGAAGAVHQTHGIYLAEIYGKTIFEITPVQIYLLLKFNPDEPWDTKYKKWKMYVGVGYELDTWLYTFRDEYEITTSELNF